MLATRLRGLILERKLIWCKDYWFKSVLDSRTCILVQQSDNDDDSVSIIITFNKITLTVFRIIKYVHELDD